MSSSKISFLQRNIHIIMVLFFVTALSGCSSASDTSEDSLKTPSLLLVTSSPSNVKKPTFKVENVEKDGTISIYSDRDCTQEIEIDSDSITSIGTDLIRFNILNEISPDDNYFYYAKQTNNSGKSSSCSSSVSYILDTVASQPTLALTEETSSPSVNTMPSFLVSNVEDRAVVSLHTDRVCSEANKVDSGTASGNSITLEATALSSDGVYTYYAKQEDSARNISDCSSAVEYELDRNVPTPMIGLTQETVSPSQNTTPSFFVSNVEDGSMVSLHTDSECLEANKVDSGTASGNSITLEATALSSDGVYTYYAKQEDSIGNSSCSDSISYSLDTMAAAPTLLLVTSSSADNPFPIFSLDNLEIEGTVRLYSDESCSTIVQDEVEITEERMQITLSIALTDAGTYSYYSKQTDKSGNISTCSTPISYEFISNSFITVWHVGSMRHGDRDNTVTLPLRSGYEYDFTVNWGDGTQLQTFATYRDITHNYQNAGEYTVTITGPKFPVWYFNNDNDGDKEKIIEVKNLGIVGWKNLKRAFEGCVNLTKFTAGNTDTSNVVATDSMFGHTSNLTDLDLSGFDTSNVTNMNYMFSSAIGLTELDLSGFDTSNVKTMRDMFSSTLELVELDLSNFNTLNVKEMNSMFNTTPKLVSLNLSNWNTSNVTKMQYMFNQASGLTSLDLSHFDTSNVTSMKSMFQEASGLNSLDLSNWNTSSLENIENMFRDATGLRSLNLSNWNIPNVEGDTTRIFENTSSLVLTCSMESFFGKTCTSN